MRKKFSKFVKELKDVDWDHYYQLLKTEYGWLSLIGLLILFSVLILILIPPASFVQNNEELVKDFKATDWVYYSNGSFSLIIQPLKELFVNNISFFSNNLTTFYETKDFKIPKNQKVILIQELGKMNVSNSYTVRIDLNYSLNNVLSFQEIELNGIVK